VTQRLTRSLSRPIRPPPRGSDVCSLSCVRVRSGLKADPSGPLCCAGPALLYSRRPGLRRCRAPASTPPTKACGECHPDDASNDTECHPDECHADERPQASGWWPAGRAGLEAPSSRRHGPRNAAVQTISWHGLFLGGVRVYCAAAGSSTGLFTKIYYGAIMVLTLGQVPDRCRTIHQNPLRGYHAAQRNAPVQPPTP
jgi:hypothetical protein